MSKISIVNRYTREIIVEGEYNDIKSLLENNRRVDLRYADLRCAELQSADLRGADLRGAELQSADLQSADLRNADLRNADLSNADLRYANLSNADLRYANLYNADLRNANLSGANIDFSSWPLWCGSLKVKIDDKIKAQLLYHVISVIGVERFTDEQLEFANTFHHVGEVPKLSR